MRDERLDVFVPAVPVWKTYTKNAVLWLYGWHLISLELTQRIYDRLDLKDA